MHKLGKYLLLILLIAVSASCGKKEPPVVDKSVEPVRIAVTSEFLRTAKLLADQFTTQTAIGVEFTRGTDSELTQMIMEGADVDVLMASDTDLPQQLIDKGKAMAEGASVYALGTVALYSRGWKLNWNAVQYLESGQFSAISVPAADNRYGEAGISALRDTGVYESVKDKLVYTDDEAESLELVNTRTADAGFIALSSISDREKRWAWIVPQEMYPPIEQGAVLIDNDPPNQSAMIWMGYLGSEAARSVIRQSGYGVVDDKADVSLK